MHINGLDDIDNKLLALLKENARYSYSELAGHVGISRVAVKNRIEAMEHIGLIRGYEVKIAPKKVDRSVEFVINTCPRPEQYDQVLGILAGSDLILKIQAATGSCRIFAFGVAPDSEVMGDFYRKLSAAFVNVQAFSFDVIASTLKDVDGGIEYAESGEKRA